MNLLRAIFVFLSIFISGFSIVEIAVIVNNKKPTESISVSDVNNIYKVRVSRFTDSSPINISYQRAVNDGFQLFVNFVIVRPMIQLYRFWASRLFDGRLLRPVNLNSFRYPSIFGVTARI